MIFDYPYTDMHELNLDWFLAKFKELVENWNNVESDWNSLHDYVQNYFEYLNVQTEIDNKINAMILDGTFADIVSPFVTAALPALVAGQLPDVVAAQISAVVASQIYAVVAAQLPAVAAAAAAQEVGTWLAANIDPDTGYVIDKTLTVSDAAADAKVAGDKIQSEEELLQYYETSLTLLEGYYNQSTGIYNADANFRSTSKMLYYGVPEFSVEPRNCNVWSGDTYIGRYAYEDFADIPEHDTISFTWTNTAAANGVKMTPEGDLYKAVKELKNGELAGKSLVVDGSSIMYGAGYTGGWAKILHDDYGMSVTNRAVNGATTAIIDDNHHALARSIDTTPTSDYFIFDTMRNDYVLNVPFGIPSDSNDYNPTLDKTTFCGAFEYVCQKLATDYGTEKIGYLFDHRRPPLDDVFVNTWEPYAIATLKKWGIPFLNLEELDPPIGFIPDLYNNYTASSDKVHPNEQGYRIFYVPKIVAWLKTL